MPRVEVNLPDQVNDQIDRLVDQGEFLNRDQAVEELLSMGVSTYDTTDDTTELENEDMFTQTISDQRDPAMREDQPDDEYTL